MKELGVVIFGGDIRGSQICIFDGLNCIYSVHSTGYIGKMGLSEK